MKKFRYFIEAGCLHCLFMMFACMPLSWASNTGGFLGRMIGPHLAASRKAITNMQSTLPHLDTKHTLADMWDNLGRTIAEYPHLKNIIENHTEYAGHELIQPYIDAGKPIIFISGHFANWEISHCGASFLTQNTMHCLHRETNNPWVRKLIHRCRTRAGDVEFISKTRSSARQMLRVMQDNGQIGILIDQKYNEGIAVPFLGKPAMTGTAFAKMAQKFDVPIVPLRMERIKGHNFRLRVCEPIPANRDVETILRSAHALLEEWIKDKPGQWIWMHRRWDSEALKNNDSEPFKETEEQEAA